jgi:hypothetical protein
MYRILLILIVMAAQICRAQEPTALPDSIKGGEMIFIAKGDSSYYIDKYEVTNAEYAEFLNARGNQQEDGAYWIELRSRFALIEEKEGTFAAKDSFASACRTSANGAMPARATSILNTRGAMCSNRGMPIFSATNTTAMCARHRWARIRRGRVRLA